MMAALDILAGFGGAVLVIVGILILYGFFEHTKEWVRDYFYRKRQQAIYEFIESIDHSCIDDFKFFATPRDTHTIAFRYASKAEEKQSVLRRHEIPIWSIAGDLYEEYGHTRMANFEHIVVSTFAARVRNEVDKFVVAFGLNVVAEQLRFDADEKACIVRACKESDLNPKVTTVVEVKPAVQVAPDLLLDGSVQVGDGFGKSV